MAQWDTYRIPVDFALVRRTDDPNYRPENALFRQMLQEFRRPAWCQEVVVTADAAYASRANLALIQTLGYWYVLALPRTWKFANGKALKALVTHLPRWSTSAQGAAPSEAAARWGRAQHMSIVPMTRTMERETDAFMGPSYAAGQPGGLRSGAVARDPPP